MNFWEEFGPSAFATRIRAEANCQGLIIHNDAQHFSCGADLESILGFIVDKDMDGLDHFLGHYQRTLLSMKYAPIPVVAAPSGLSIGGGFEVLLHTDKVIFHANLVTGLVDSLVGVVPGGGGVKEMLYRWYERTGDINKAAWSAFMNIGYAKTAVVSMGAGYRVIKRTPLTPHDVTTGTQIAMIVTGGDIDAGTKLSENDLFALERKAFLTLGQTDGTRSRIEFMLEYGRPLRN